MGKNTVTEEGTPPENNDTDLMAIPELPPISEKDSSFVDKPTASENTDEDKERHRGTLSSNKDVYDPSIHTYPPKETTAGNWKKQGGRGKGKKADGTPVNPNADYRAAAQQTATIYAHLNRAAMGEGAEVVKEELVPLIDAWEGYYQVNGLRRVPPWLSVALASGMYSYGVATRPKVKDRVAKFFLKLAIAAKLFKPKKQEARADAHANSGDK